MITNRSPSPEHEVDRLIAPCASKVPSPGAQVVALSAQPKGIHQRDRIPVSKREPIEADPGIDLAEEHILVDEPADQRVVKARPHIKQPVGISLHSVPAVELEGLWSSRCD